METSWRSVFSDHRIEGFDGVRRLDCGECDRGQTGARVVVDENEDLGPGGVGEVPLGGVGLPELVWELRLEAHG